jgi:Lanthionine synthetase C-like protein
MSLLLSGKSLRGAVVLAFVCAVMASNALGQAEDLINAGAHSLATRATPVTWITGAANGYAWQSVIQEPNYQTDRDVGASSVGMGLLAAYDTTGNADYLQYARGAGDFLLAAQTPAGRWPDYYNPKGPASYGFTSFDDGAPGIADFLWRLYERTADSKYKAAALKAMDWEVSVARGPAGKKCPAQACYWRWFDPPDSNIYTGMGEGVAGIAWTFDEFSRRLSGCDPVRSRRYSKYARAAAAYLESRMNKIRLQDGSMAAKMPEQPASTAFDTGFLSGSAGDAFVFYKLYASTQNPRYLEDANQLFAWVRSQALTSGSCPGVKWHIEESGDNLVATGVEEGNAGIGWVAIQAAKILAPLDPALAATDLQLARGAGDWLLSSCAAFPEGGGTYWPEDEGRILIHTSLDNGAPGIAVFLYDLYLATGNRAYLSGSQNAETWVRFSKFTDTKGAYWCENRRNGKWHLCGEPSWHWGTAGIINMAARLSGWALDIPGEEPAP